MPLHELADRVESGLGGIDSEELPDWQLPLAFDALELCQEQERERER